MKKQTLFIGAILSVLMLATLLAFSSFAVPGGFVSDSQDALKYNSNVCIYVTRIDGIVEDLGCSHNLLTTAGKNGIRTSLTGIAGESYEHIGLCNSSYGGSCTTPALTDTTLGNEYNDASGLNRTGPTTYLALGIGNWSYSRTFVALADGMSTNLTGIFDNTVGGTMLAVNTFTTSTLQTNDQITVNWSIWVA